MRSDAVRQKLADKTQRDQLRRVVGAGTTLTASSSYNSLVVQGGDFQFYGCPDAATPLQNADGSFVALAGYDS
jgi:hypothetical protein